MLQRRDFALDSRTSRFQLFLGVPGVLRRQKEDGRRHLSTDEVHHQGVVVLQAPLEQEHLLLFDLLFDLQDSGLFLLQRLGELTSSKLLQVHLAEIHLFLHFHQGFLLQFTHFAGLFLLQPVFGRLKVAQQLPKEITAPGVRFSRSTFLLPLLHIIFPLSLSALFLLLFFTIFILFLAVFTILLLLLVIFGLLLAMHGRQLGPVLITETFLCRLHSSDVIIDLHLVSPQLLQLALQFPHGQLIAVRHGISQRLAPPPRADSSHRL
mmetsp:Transcript_35230/g.71929  ORF Transcript_35230/g.71929 Transcript_35230/m.71929 type:complete len:265 (+) Transcript_35230:199-993(+)